MKTPEQIVAGLKQDITVCEAKVKALAPNAYLHGDTILAEQTKIKFALNLINWIES